MRLPVNTAIHTTLVGLEPTTFRLLVRRATSSATATDSQTLYNRLRIGHTHLTHSLAYLLKDEDPPICIPCNSLLTVEHILVSYIDFDIIR